MAMVFGPAWSYAASQYELVFAKWFCHDEADVLELAYTLPGDFPRKLSEKIVVGECAYAAFELRYVFAPLGHGKLGVAADGFEFEIIPGMVLSQHAMGPFKVYAMGSRDMVVERDEKKPTDSPAIRDEPGFRGWLI